MRVRGPRIVNYSLALTGEGLKQQSVTGACNTARSREAVTCRANYTKSHPLGAGQLNWAGERGVNDPALAPPPIGFPPGNRGNTLRL